MDRSTVRFTNREAQVLECLSVGMRTKQVAHELKISAGTVKMYLFRMYERLGLHTSSHAVAVYVEQKTVARMLSEGR